MVFAQAKERNERNKNASFSFLALMAKYTQKAVETSKALNRTTDSDRALSSATDRTERTRYP